MAAEDLEAAETGIGTTGDPVLDEAKRRFMRCVEWEAASRERFVDDVRFANGDADNGYQWPNSIRRARDVDSRPCLTINIIRQHNLQIINEGKKNKNQVKVVGVGNGATVESAGALQMVVEHIQYQSAAQAAYSVAREWQVAGGIGYWRIVTEYVEDSFDQEAYIAPIPDPLAVYMDPDIKQRDGRDCGFAFVFDTLPREDFREAYPQYAHLASLQPMGISTGDSDWVGKNHVRVCEYFRKVPRSDKLVSFVDAQSGTRKTIRHSRLHKELRGKILDDPLTRIRMIEDQVVEWKLIVGDEIIDETEWPGKYIPIIRILGEETTIGGILDRKGHTRAMKDAQRMYNYNSSGQVEFVALQSKTPWTGAADAIEEYEAMWNTANTANHSYLPFKHLDDNGDPIPPQALPRRQDPPNASPAFEAGMQTAFNQMMMASGQWQNQMGMMGNERTGQAIQKRQDQGDTATYHFQDNYELGLVFTGMQLIDLIPKIYDTKRLLRIQSDNGADMELEIDPSARQAYLQQQAKDGAIVRRVLNPQIGRYDVRAVPGAAFGSRREETVQALTLILTQAPGLTGIIGDLLLQAMDFKEAQEAAQRLRRMVPPQALGQGPTQQEQALMQQNQALRTAMQLTLQKLGKEQLKVAGKDQMRDIDAYKAETDRFKALSDVLQLDPEGIQQVLDQLVQEAGRTSLTPILAANQGDIGAATTPRGPLGQMGSQGGEAPGAAATEWYLTDPTRRGRLTRIAPLAQEHTRPGIVGNA